MTKKEKIKILGFQTGHDVSYCVLEDGVPIHHEELERFTREKEPLGDGLRFGFDSLGNEVENIKYFTLGNFGMYQPKGIRKWGPRGCYDHNLVRKMKDIIVKNDGEFFEVGHHLSHAANAFLTSDFDDALIITIDGGGMESDGTVTAFTIAEGVNNTVKQLKVYDINDINLGGIWDKVTSKVFNLSIGYPIGNQAGSVMAMATMGTPKYLESFNLKNIDYEKLKTVAAESEKESFNVAASLQKFTENTVKEYLSHYIEKLKPKNICFSGGVSLNCVMVGKIKQWFSCVENVFCDPVPYDAGLSLGSARYVWHCVLGNPRIKNKENKTSYLGRQYNKQTVINCLKNNEIKLSYNNSSDNEVINLLADNNIISVFGGKSESGRRALGNRSILANPKDEKMKDIINSKVKHRQWYRPFAPSILAEEVDKWFEENYDSPYMSFAVKFKESKRKLVPAVAHYDGTGRLQTVSEDTNSWYYGFIRAWYEKSGVPILLNTSFNDREPIVETPEHAINCFLRTNIDYLYFYDSKILVSKKEKK